MKPIQAVKILVAFGLILVCLARPLTEKDKAKLIKIQPKMKSPPIDEFLDGNVSKKGRVFTYEFQYKNLAEEKTCNVTYKEKMMAGGTIESTHKWKCRGKMQLDDDTKDLVGEDYA
uniref:37S ribosomal protein S25, mitochondrial n=1 Tax=Lygus hesperus TaxID=30085 RepID=A0A0A9YF57_LYGHE